MLDMKKINPEKFYTPKEIVSLGIIPADRSGTQMLLRHIRQGKVEALNLGGDKKPRYAVQGKNLLKYKDTQMKPGQYETK